MTKIAGRVKEKVENCIGKEKVWLDIKGFGI